MAILLLSPLKYSKDLIFHSNTANLYMFQAPFRHLTVLNVVRVSLVGLHVLLYLCLFAGVILCRQEWRTHCLLFVPPITAFVFLALYYRAIEQRYMLPFLPLILCAAGMTLERAIRYGRLTDTLPRPVWHRIYRRRPAHLDH